MSRRVPVGGESGGMLLPGFVIYRVMSERRFA